MTMPATTTVQDPRKTATISWGALLFSLLAFLAIATFVRPSMRPADPKLTSLLTLIASLLAVVEVAVSRLVPRFIRRLDGTTPDQHALRQNIVAAALCEGAGLFCVVVWMISATPWILVPLAVALVGLAACFPSDGRWESLGGSVQR
jgi:hypothetical protein